MEKYLSQTTILRHKKHDLLTRNPKRCLLSTIAKFTRGSLKMSFFPGDLEGANPSRIVSKEHRAQRYGLHVGRLSRKRQKIMKTMKTTQTATNKELSAGLAEITENTEMTKPRESLASHLWGSSGRGHCRNISANFIEISANFPQNVRTLS